MKYDFLLYSNRQQQIYRTVRGRLPIYGRACRFGKVVLARCGNGQAIAAKHGPKL
jgi:hypothetical protein